MEEWQLKLMELADMASIKEKTISSFVSTWKPIFFFIETEKNYEILVLGFDD